MLDNLADIQVNNGIINKQDKELFVFGLKEGLIMLGNLSTTILIGLFLGMWWQSIAFIFFYSPLRVFAGGSHSKTHLRCYLSSILITILVLILIKFLPNNYIIFSSIALISGTIILWLTPVEDKNKPLDKLEVNVYKKKTRNILLIEIAISLILITLNIFEITKCIVVSLFVLAIILVIGKIKNHREANQAKKVTKLYQNE